MGDENKLIVFENKKIRHIWHKGDWWFSVVDVVGVLDASGRPRKYWADLKKKLVGEGSELSEFIGQLKMESSDGKEYLTDCANKEGLFRIIQSIPSKKAEPFKLWLAKVGSERIDEIENPELAQKRMKELYKSKGYSSDWIEKRVRGIAVRDELTDEWSKRGIKTKKEYSILTAEISKATFGLTPNEYKNFKGLKRENLRDHMDDLELIFNMLGEASTTKIARSKNPLGFNENKNVAKEGGAVAGVARKELERKSGEQIVTSENYLKEPESIKKKKNLIKIQPVGISDKFRKKAQGT